MYHIQGDMNMIFNNERSQKTWEASISTDTDKRLFKQMISIIKWHISELARKDLLQGKC